ncbi:Hypothetical predicted protein [Cloeon dipterum]|uniref:Uncharacterized protein n=1 Tax=Cloeon dipterum TaxID=197152 RepID=A0A8S1DE86_9INSE|nr:Hypothetical predicted protein [Cloeon dipterum]
MSTAIRVKVSELLKMVRFKAFTARDFAQLFMDNSSILTPQEKMSIFSFVHTQQGPLLESLIGFDLNSGWRGRFHPDTKIVLLTSNDVKDDNQNRQWLAPKRNTYLLSVGVDASKYLKVNKKLYIKIGINGVKSVDDGTIATFDSSFFSGSDNMEQNNKMIRLTMPYLLKNRFIYTVYVTESNQPTERLRKCEFGSDLNVTFPGIQIDWIMWSGGMGEIIAYEFGRPISPSEME